MIFHFTNEETESERDCIFLDHTIAKLGLDSNSLGSFSYSSMLYENVGEDSTILSLKEKKTTTCQNK